MPAKCTLFDSRAQPMYELGTGARNTVKYSPSGRFFLIGGFGNLAGDMVTKLVFILGCMGTRGIQENCYYSCKQFISL